ncbi:MAG TPA: xanthine dehydrogenase family protein subunit M [Actinomycetes bacterium]|nr:xanthine dehydrogenase family protein subunit M [Actinomycetes bacterium]
MQTPAPVDYERATSVDDALARLARLGPESRLIAGGHSLLPMMKLRLARPETVIDINGLSDLDYIRVEGSELVLGALTRHAALLASPVVGEHYAMIPDAERVIADPIVRNRGTVGGSFCQADPAEDLSAVGSALKATLVIRSAQGTRTVPAREFHEGPYETVVGDAEILIEVRIPIRPGAGSAYEKVERRAGDWAAAAAGAYIVLADGVISDVGIGLTAVGAPHFCAPEAEAYLVGKPPTDEHRAEAGRRAAEASSPSADQRGPVDYKRHLAGELTVRALRRSVARAEGRV